MPYSINETHDPQVESWVHSANARDADFPLQNLPFCVFARRNTDETPRVGTAIGDRILDIPGCLSENLLTGVAAEAAEACRAEGLNDLMALGPASWSDLRRNLWRLLKHDSTEIQANPLLAGRLLIPMAEVKLFAPAHVGDFTDFYASLFHATNVGRMFRPENPLLPNYKYVPVAYHGRASSIVVSGTEIRRPSGQIQEGGTVPPTFGPSRQLDYELEVGFFAGSGNRLGTPIPIADAMDHIFGFCLVNDWSARDIQRWEYQPLGPFLSKSFATSISPWVVTLEALEPFRCAGQLRSDDDPRPLPYLHPPEGRGAIDIFLEVFLSTTGMRQKGIGPAPLSRSNFKELYWTPAQMIAHHASNGCNLRPGDLIASGTVSGPARESCGCLLELTWRGMEPVRLPGNEQRSFLEDGDEVILRGYCRRPGYVGIGFGECRGMIGPADPLLPFA